MHNFKKEIGAIIYSRMMSKRFPNKAVYNLCGKSLLERVISKTKLIKGVSKIILATSDLPVDDDICKVAHRNNIYFYRGSHLNVYQRTTDILHKFQLDYFLRICGDRPLLDPYLHDLAIKQTLKNNLDLCTTLNPKILPAGLTVEVLSSKSFLNVNSSTIEKYDMEHITNRYYNSLNLHNIKNINLPKSINWKSKKNISYTFDKKEDIDFLEFNINNLNNVTFGIKYHLKLQNLALKWDKIKNKD